ncbi:MAG: hypothetical protein IJP68_04425 [Selenomonadaceae bacterium]|nr:hypothetical protein [Selenomonadaceae bacterium]
MVNIQKRGDFMQRHCDDFPQETWGRADNDMPQDYLQGVLAQIKAIQPARHSPKTDAELDGSDKLHAIEARWKAREMPRNGQPSFDAPLVEWYREYQFRNRHPLWYEKEYHYTDNGKLIHTA